MGAEVQKRVSKRPLSVKEIDWGVDEVDVTSYQEVIVVEVLDEITLTVPCWNVPPNNCCSSTACWASLARSPPPLSSGPLDCWARFGDQWCVRWRSHGCNGPSSLLSKRLLECPLQLTLLHCRTCIATLCLKSLLWHCLLHRCKYLSQLC